MKSRGRCLLSESIRVCSLPLGILELFKLGSVPSSSKTLTRTVTGLSECVSVAGPLLGGGHSLLQGQHGFALDSLVSAKVVTSTGEVVEASHTQNPDLFWALRGVGHNFGIVTSLVVKTYDIPSDWTVYKLVYTGDKLEALFSLVNSFEEPGARRPAKLTLTGVFIRIPAIDAKDVSPPRPTTTRKLTSHRPSWHTR
jgi:FAD/FMN-containing dehydrogenase